MVRKYVKLQLVIGIAVNSISAIVFAISLPALFAGPCIPVADNFRVCPTPPASHEIELSLSLFGVAFGIGGIALLALYHSEQKEIRNRQ